MTEDQSPLRQIMRLRGFNVMKNILDDYVQDVEMITLVCFILSFTVQLEVN